MPYKDPKNPNNVAYRKRYYHENKDTLWSYANNPKRGESVMKWRKNHPDRQKQAVLNYHTKNRETLILKSKNYRDANKDTLNKKCNLKTELLTDGYMKKHLRKLGYSPMDIKQYPELIETHRLIIKIKRYEKHQGTS